MWIKVNEALFERLVIAIERLADIKTAPKGEFKITELIPETETEEEENKRTVKENLSKGFLTEDDIVTKDEDLLEIIKEESYPYILNA